MRLGLIRGIKLWYSTKYIYSETRSNDKIPFSQIEINQTNCHRTELNYFLFFFFFSSQLLTSGHFLSRLSRFRFIEADHLRRCLSALSIHVCYSIPIELSMRKTTLITTTFSFIFFKIRQNLFIRLSVR